jgi:hypothetical protein
MKTLLAVVAVLFVASLPAHAQARFGSSGGSALAFGGGGGGGAVGSSVGVLPMTPRTIRYSNPSAHGTETDFNLTSFVPYDDAVKMGLAVINQKPKPIAQVAAEYRASKKHPRQD